MIKSGEADDDSPLAELLDLIEEKSAVVVTAVGHLETRIGKVDA
ncbi:hypothetical protein AGMMS50289_05740 [Betaproteobacteria bacterium]|nr:hypothetical protein AGMMS50289_05740 [Betaproteobacteria bacterium]